MDGNVYFDVPLSAFARKSIGAGLTQLPPCADDAKVEKAMRQRKMFWLCIGDCTTFMKSMLGLYNIYTIYIPSFDAAKMETVYFTHGRSEVYSPLQHPTAVTQVEMEGMCSLSLSEHEAIRFWARLSGRIFDGVGNFSDFTLLTGNFSDFPDFIPLMEMRSLSTLMGIPEIRRSRPSMIIMDEDGNLITKQGKEIIELLSEEHLYDKAKGLVQQLINGDKESRKETLIQLQKLMKKLMKGRQRK